MVLWRFAESDLRSWASFKAEGTSGAAQLMGRIQGATVVLPHSILLHSTLPHATLPHRVQPKEVMMLRALPGATPEAGAALHKLG